MRHKITWMSPDAVTENQIDHLCVCRKFRRSLLDVRVKRGADAASDHHLLTAKIQLKLKRMDQVKVAGDRVRFCVDRLKEREIEQAVQTKVKNKFQALCDLAKDEENKVDTLEDLWEGAKTAWIETCEEELGTAKREDKPWISNDTLTQINERKLKKEHLNKARTRHHKQVAQKNYLAVHKVVRASIKRDKRHYYDELAREGEEAAAKGNLRQLYENTRRLTNKWRCSSGPIKDSTGKLLTSETDQGA